ncbi:MAG TPA: CxxxxCH/CxxCH domain-containing protein [Myxococcales bacterium]
MNPAPVLCRARLFGAALAAVGASILGAACSCGEAPLGNGMPDPATITCTRCHGDPATGNPAPPADLDGRSDPRLVGVGAHQQHLRDGALRKAVGCSECHPVPLTWDEPGHNNGTGRATVAWGPLASQQGVLAPSWDHAEHTCSGVYCHGQTLGGGSLKKPDWIVLDGTQAACGSCHGNPPPAPHPAASQCNTCHALTVRSDGSIDVEGGHHVDGILDVPSMACTSCHGTAGRTGADPHVDAAPPVGTHGETLTTDPAVGAHLQHLSGGLIRSGVACGECHAVPSDAAHADGRSPKLVFGPLATARGVTPSEDPATRTCSSTYCHGATLSGGSNKLPKWTLVDGTQASCGTCHGNPPPAPHPQRADCASCHPGTVHANGTIDLAGGLHINGVLDVPGLGCTSCHGTAGRTGSDPHLDAAPPLGTHGETDTASPAVGAHLKHLTDSAIRSAISCSDCHAVPADSAHADGKSPKLVWGALAKTGNLTPSQDPAAHTCSSNWCHGASLSGGSNKVPVWTTLDGSQAACGTCHGNPPPAPHPQNPACATCHPGTVLASGAIDVAGGRHIDGVVDLPALTCTSCHGTDGRTSVAGADALQPAAPPLDTAGNATAASRGVGAHLRHVNPGAGAVAKPFACGQCHTVPTQMDHAIGVVDMTFGALATAQGSSPTWTRASNTCASAWCHGGNPKLGGAARPAIVWTDATPTDCTSCHGNPPPSPHPQNDACATCHTGYSKTGATTGTVDVATHVDGKIDVGNLTCTSCHGTTGRTGADPAVAAAPPAGTHGETASTARAVGAHLAHLQAGALSNPVACSECHAVPSSQTHATGTVEMAFGTLAKTRGAAPAWNGTTCASAYCHGQFKNGNLANAPAWTAGAPGAACGTCHGSAVDPTPGGTHPKVAPTTSCGDCHAGYTRTTVALAKHINGVVDVSGMTCTSCHGDKTTNDPAPPVDTAGNSATTARGVGAHQGHVHAGSLAKGFACAECHVDPTTMIHADGTVDMVFGALANQSIATAWSSGTATCASNYCHGGSPALKGGLQTTPVWTKVDGTQKTCQSCHGNPPPPPHVQNDACGSCHTGYAKTGAATGTVDPARHVNGTVDVVALACTTCHGTTGRASVANADPRQAAAPPADTTGATAATDLQVGAHLAHVNHGAGAVSNPVACAQCHPVPSAMSHADGTRQVTFGTVASAQGSAPTWTAGSGTCASTWCHGGNALLHGATKPSIVWNDGTTTTNCTSCHGNPPPAPHVQNDACGNCHPGYSKSGATTGGVNLATHVNGTIDYATLACTSCHGDPTRTGSDPNVAAAPPVGTAGETATTDPAVGAHLAHLQPGPYSNGVACGECHVVPTGMTHADGTSTVTFGTLSRTGGATPSYSGTTCSSAYCHGQFRNGNSTNQPTWTGGAGEAACGTCHGTPTDPTPVSGHPAVAPTKSCGDCHDGYTRTTVNLALHVNGKIDGGGEPSTPGSSCAGCHDAIFQGMTGGVAKATRHALGGGDDPVDPGGAWNTAATLKASPLYASASCVSMCHGDHPHDLTSPATATHQNNVHLDANARSANRTSTTRAATDFMSSGTGGLCLSCHVKPVDATHPALDQAAFAASAHNYTSNAQGTWQYALHDGSAFARNCTKCHADPADARPGATGTSFGAVHFSTNPSLLAGTPRSAGAPANLLCYRCHGNATTGQDLSGKDVATQIAKPASHPVDADAVHDSAAEDAAPASTYNNGRYSGANRHANCQDCHSPHESKAGAHAYATTATSTRNAVSGPLTGVSGVQFNSSGLGNFAAPAAANFAWTPAATAEYQICFKCHTSFTFGATPPNGLSANGSATAPVETDLAQEFNPNNKSGHPVVTGLNNYANSAAPRALDALDLVAPWSTNVGTQTMMCSDCHNTDAASPAAQGPHGSAVAFMVRGGKTGWPTASASATGFGTTMCSNCHNNAPIHTVDGAHSVPCYRCHVVVPHGGKMSRLIGDRDSAAMPSRYAYNNDKNTLYVRSFTKATRGNYSKSNCQASCTTEHGTAATENW